MFCSVIACIQIFQDNGRDTVNEKYFQTGLYFQFALYFIVNMFCGINIDQNHTLLTHCTTKWYAS